MIEIYDRARQKKAILQNAFQISESLKMNAVYQMTFSLPFDDAKNEFCNPFWYAKLGTRLYRILPSVLNVSETGTITYTCEHVVATLIDRVLFGYHHIGGLGVYTRNVIEWILSGQSDWRLGKCDFARQYEYGWEQESRLSALFSIPNRFTETYLWQYDTENYPWTIHLRLVDMNAIPQMYVRSGKNMKSLTKEKDPGQLCTRIYPLGYGEGVNQLGIKNVNGGIPYLQSPKNITDKYGIIERIWTDRRYEDAESLKQAAQVMLNELQEPYEEYSVSFAEMDGGYYDEAELGKVVEIIDSSTGIRKKTLITELQIDVDNPGESTMNLANKSLSIASTVADMADRQRIEMSSAQGATQLYSQSLQANATKTDGAVISFFIPEEMRIINKLLLKVKLEPFRAYSKATQGGGATTQTSSAGGSFNKTSSSGGGSTQTSSSGGGSTQTSSSGGSSTQTSSSGGGSTQTSSSGGGYSQSSGSGGGVSTSTENSNWEGSGTETTSASLGGTIDSHQHAYDPYLPHTHDVEVSSHTHDVEFPDHTHSTSIPAHTHKTSIPAHTHSTLIPKHTHTLSTPAHTHTVSVAAHTHSLSLPNHTHEITPGVYRFGNPSSFSIFVNGTEKERFSTTNAELDITKHLLRDGKIPRGNWLSVEVRPNDLAYVSLVIYVQGFVQSRGDITV